MVVGPNATLVSQGLVNKIRNNEFIKLAELAGDNRDKTACGAENPRKRITSIMQWVKCFNAYITILDQPDRVPDLLAYSSLIVHATRKFRGDGWIHYDRNVRKSAAAGAKDKWGGAIKTSLWALAFSNAQPQEHCALCLV